MPTRRQVYDRYAAFCHRRHLQQQAEKELAERISQRLQGMTAQSDKDRLLDDLLKQTAFTADNMKAQIDQSTFDKYKWGSYGQGITITAPVTAGQAVIGSGWSSTGTATDSTASGIQ